MTITLTKEEVEEAIVLWVCERLSESYEVPSVILEIVDENDLVCTCTVEEIPK